jgi:hypothetical protein
MLERHLARTKTVHRQVLSYQEHHGARSLQTVIEAWRKTPTAQPDDIGEMLEQDGLAFTLQPGDGTVIEFYLFPGQDTMLRRVAGLRADERAAAQAALEYLYATVDDPAQRELLLRPAGPVAVDANRAAPPVLAAIVRGVLGDGSAAREYERALLDARFGDEPIKMQTLANIATEVELESEQRTLIGRFLTVTPEVWRFRVDMREERMNSRGPLLSQYAGLMMLGARSASPTGGGGFEEPSPFLTWEKLNPGDPRAVE